jgi:hypothetical protein
MQEIIFKEKISLGTYIDPCTWPYGSIFDGTDCSDVNPVFIYSGDPVNNSGWINTFPVRSKIAW